MEQGGQVREHQGGIIATALNRVRRAAVAPTSAGARR